MKTLNPWRASRGTPDVIGIGALNVDYIAPFSRLKLLQPDVVEELRTRFEHGSERAVSTQELELLLTRLASFTTPYPGGSAFNAIHCMRQIRAGITVGYVGTAGTTSRVNFAELFERLDIDGRYVQTLDTPARRCLSYTEDGKRTLVTERGVRGGLAHALDSKRELLLDYLSAARIIHVTSLTHDGDTQFVSDLVLEARRRTPALRLSVDPGLLWAEAAAGAPPSRAVLDLLALADYVFLNPREFKVLANPMPLGNKLDAVCTLLPEPPSRQRLLILKDYENTELYTRVADGVVDRSYPHEVLPSEEIEDSTGAGDVFAGAFIAGILLGLDYSESSVLAARLVRAKLLGSGSGPYEQFGSLLTTRSKAPAGDRPRSPASVSDSQDGPSPVPFDADAPKTDVLDLSEPTMRPISRDGSPILPATAIYVQGGVVSMAENQFNTVGAVGPNASALDFSPTWNAESEKIDLALLAGELRQLRIALRERPSSARNDAALGAVAEAETAAESGDGPRVLEYLRRAGVWTLDVAKDIGVEVAASVLKKACGIS